MEKNYKEKLKKNNGITLIALVITIIVLLILAGVSLSIVFSQDGIFNRAEQGADKYRQAKARETLEMLLGEAQMQKYEIGLTDEELTDKINSIGEDIKEGTNPRISQAIVDGYIFEVDRTVPKILDYIGPADGVIITASVNGLSSGWIKPDQVANISVTGRIVTYSGGTIMNSTATNNGTTISGFPTNGGDYTINNITSDAIIVISAQDSNGKSNSKTIPITIRVDNIPPVVDSVTAEATGLKIKFSATGHDNESGLKHFNYTITSEQDTTLEGIPADKRTGVFTQGKTVEIITTKEMTYSISVTATDNCDNISDVQMKEVTTVDKITIDEAKELVNENTLQQYIGKEVEYNPAAGGTWRIFYYDAENYFGDGIGTLYLKRDLVGNETSLKEISPSDGGATMRKMNPKWANSAYSAIDTKTERYAAWLCDPDQWTIYKDESAEYAIGSPSVELYMKAYNVYKENNPNGMALINKVENGYLVGANGKYDNSGFNTNNNSIESGFNNVFIPAINYGIIIASPTASSADNYLWIDRNNKKISFVTRSRVSENAPIAAITK